MKRDEKPTRKKYEAPTVTPVPPGGLPREARGDLARLVWGRTGETDGHAASDGYCTVELDLQGKFTRVSEEFCRLVGYERRELLGQPIDRVTVSATVNVPQHLGAVFHFGSFHSLWMFVDRGGRGVLVQSDWGLHPDMSILVFCRLMAHLGLAASAGQSPLQNPG